MKTLHFLVIVILSAFVISCKSETEKTTPLVYEFTTNLILDDIKKLSSDEFEGRKTSTLGATKAKDYIKERFKKLNVIPLLENFEQSFSFTHGEKDYSAVNVLGLIKGTEHTDKYIILSAHYDHLGIINDKIFNGADDNASGVAALFAFAEYFKTHPPKHNVILASFDAEELGLKGAYHFADNSIIDLNKIVLNLNFDMISRSDSKELYAVGTRYSQPLKETISSFDNIDGVELLIGHEGLDNLDDWTNSSDHAAFHKKNIPFIYFGVPDHKDYHKSTDVYESIDQQFTINAIQTLLNVFTQLDAKKL
ncbi:M28 family peptidase [Tenacibaculum ovolyticum]|uniref:M28 family peptidase n=1 Tax=Tenacibaculum ovolyticum TaxID=104270 RepID=UPI00040A363F|nr:M28 family peptidase [Tenacibaculum ovolyticum]WBX76611.1 M28 family peptidase [Tenacibaculum ovolyticum]